MKELFYMSSLNLHKYLFSAITGKLYLTCIDQTTDITIWLSAVTFDSYHYEKHLTNSTYQ